MGPRTRAMAKKVIQKDYPLDTSSISEIYSEGFTNEEETSGKTITYNFLSDEESASPLKKIKINLENDKKEKKVNLTQPKASNVDPKAISDFRFATSNHAVYESEHMLIGLREKEKICFAGAVYITPIVGSVSVMGASLSSSIYDIKSLHTQLVLYKSENFEKENDYLDIGSLQLNRFPCYSSRTHSLLTIESKLSEYKKCTSFEHHKRDPSFLSISNFHNPSDSYVPESQIQTADDLELLNIVVKLMSEVQQGALKAGLKNPFDSYILVSTIPKNQYLSSAILLSEKKPLFGFKRDTLISGFDPILTEMPGETALDLSPVWLEAMDDFAEHSKAYVLEESDSPVIGVVCGSKNAGKSTFSKIMTNRLLRHFPAVAFINCDIGQTEFTPPGMLALHFITEPVLGPSFTQLRPPAAAYYVGEVQVKYETGRYINAIKHFIDLVTNRLHSFFQTPGITNVPIVINTLGWISGNGLELFIKLLKISFPTHVFQLGEFHTNATTEAFSTLNQSNLVSDSELEPLEVGNFKPKYCHITTLPALSQNFEFSTTFSNFTSVRLRMLTFSAYFNNSSSPYDKTNPLSKTEFFTPLVSQIPYVVSWKNFELWALEGELDISQVLYAFNGALVGLYETKHQNKIENDSNELFPPKLVKPHLAPYPPSSHYNCIGLGIIRGIDVVNGKFHIITPLPFSQLLKVNALVKGELNVPINHLTNEVQTTDTWAVLSLPEIESDRLNSLKSIPYVTTDTA